MLPDVMKSTSLNHSEKRLNAGTQKSGEIAKLGGRIAFEQANLVDHRMRVTRPKVGQVQHKCLVISEMRNKATNESGRGEPLQLKGGKNISEAGDQNGNARRNSAQT
jgi:hypothetical protein